MATTPARPTATDPPPHATATALPASSYPLSNPHNALHRWSLSTRTIANYVRLEQIGEGTYGQVYRARPIHNCNVTATANKTSSTSSSSSSSSYVALKKIRLHHAGYYGIPPTVLREIKILKSLSHPNMVIMHEVVTSKGVEELDWEEDSCVNRKKKSAVVVGGTVNGRGNKNSNAAASAGNYTNSSHGVNVTPMPSSNSNDNNNEINNNNKEKKKKSIIANEKQYDTLRESYKGNLFLVLEYVSHDLTGLLDMAYKFTEVQAKSLMMQLLGVLEYMHERKFVHRDLKSSNLLITKNFQVKLADFGLARCLDDGNPRMLSDAKDRDYSNEGEFTNKVITLWYRPPELLLGETRYTTAVDIWSAGCILAEILLGRPIFTGKTEMDQLKLIFDLIGTPTDKTWEGFRELKLIRTGEVSIDKLKRGKLREKYGGKIQPVTALNLLEKLLELDPKKRISARAALASRYFRVEPIAPSDPTQLGSIDLGDGNDGSGYHEFQTKKRRREAKAVAKQAEDEAKRLGEDVERQKEAFDKAYRDHLKKGAEKDKQKTIMKEKLEKHKRELEAQDQELQLEMQMFPEQRELDQQKEGMQRMQNQHYPGGQPPYQGGYGNLQSSNDRGHWNDYPPRQGHPNDRFGQQNDTGFIRPPNSIEDRRFNDSHNDRRGENWQERPRNPQQQQQPPFDRRGPQQQQPPFDRRGPQQQQQPRFDRGGPGYGSHPNQHAQRPHRSDQMGGGPREDNRYSSQPTQSYNDRYGSRPHQPPMDQNHGGGPREGNWSAQSDQAFNRNSEKDRYGTRPAQQQPPFDQGGAPREGRQYRQNQSFDNRNQRSNDMHGSMQQQQRDGRGPSRDRSKPYTMHSGDRGMMDDTPQRDYHPAGSGNPMAGSFGNDRRGDWRGRDVNRSAYGPPGDYRGDVPSRSEDGRRKIDGMNERESNRYSPQRQDAFVQRENEGGTGAILSTRDSERQTDRRIDANLHADGRGGDRERGNSHGIDTNRSSYERPGNFRSDAPDSRFAPQRREAPVQHENKPVGSANFTERDQERQSGRNNDRNPPSDPLIESEISLEAAEDMILQDFATGDKDSSRNYGRERFREDSDSRHRHRHRDRSDESKHRKSHKSHRHSSREHHHSSYRHRERDNHDHNLDQGMDAEVTKTGSGDAGRTDTAKSVDIDRSSSTRKDANVDGEEGGRASRERSSSSRHRKREGDSSHSRDHSRQKRSRHEDMYRDERHRHRSRGERQGDRRYEDSRGGPGEERNVDDRRSNSYAPPSNQDYDRFGNPMNGDRSGGERDNRRRGERGDERR